jgi:hypothetical protein
VSASPEVFAAARHHYGLGRNITPVEGKHPVLTDWRKRKASLEEIGTELAGRATGIGFVGGASNNNIVPLDFDSEAGEEWWRSQCEAAGIDPDDWPTAITPGKKPKDGGRRRPGRHRYVHDVRGTLTNAAGRLKDLGIDLRGHGQVLMPPSPHPDGGTYEWVPNHTLDDFPNGILPCPNFIYEAVEANPASGRTESQATRSEHDSGDSTYRYCRAALDGERHRLAGTAIKRNNALNDAALALGHLAHHEAYTKDEARAALHAACEENGLIADHDPRAFERTFLSGWRKGVSEPKEIPNMARRLATGKSLGASSPDQRSWDAVRVTDGQMPPDPSTFTAEYWLSRDLPQPDYLLGDLVTTTSRVLLIGPTGIGKTNLGLAIALAMAAGSLLSTLGGPASSSRALSRRRDVGSPHEGSAPRRGATPGIDTLDPMDHQPGGLPKPPAA